MSNFGGESYTGFKGVNLRNTAAIRFEGDGVAHTLSFRNNAESSRAFVLPDKSGVIGVSGTVVVHLPAVAATTFLYTTAVTVTGARAEDGVVASLQVASAYTSARLLHAVVPSTNTLTLTFANIGAAANGDYSLVLAYTLWR